MGNCLDCAAERHLKDHKAKENTHFQLEREAFLNSYAE